MARSIEQPENGSSNWDTNTPGLLISGPECKLSGPGRPPLVVTVVAGSSRVSLARMLLLSGGIMLAGALATLAGTLDGIVPTYAELMGNFDGAVLVGTVEGIAAVDLVLMGNLEDTLEDMVVTGTTLAEEGTELVVTELVGTSPSVLRQVAALAWSPAPFVKANPVEEEDKEVSGDGTDAMAPVKWLIRRAVRGRGLKETVGDTGPWGGVGLESTLAVEVPLSSGS